LKIYVTGRPGIGKSTVVFRAIDILKKHGLKIGGIFCPEVRGTYGYRVGFKIVDLLSNKEGWLAKKNIRIPGPRIGKYTVIVDNAISIGVKALRDAINYADVIVIDEVGPMELKVNELRKEIVNALKSNKHVIAVVHYRLRDHEIISILRNYIKFEVTFANRDKLPKIIADKILSNTEEKYGILGYGKNTHTSNSGRLG